MARPTRDPHATIDRPGQKPLLQGHLKPGGVPAVDRSGDAVAKKDEARPARSAQPAEDLGTDSNHAEAARGKATKSPADVATRPHLEGSEQGPA